ncbi:hypothetical protein QBC45DRAFT_396801 [Copromyces sp. CBS 386.78]|nr:hypothetical protein QBC45DRAFT_396801 [Copromyces sp. CBS 386.78]
MTDLFANDDDNDINNRLPFPSPRHGWDEEDPIATYYLRALNREIRALKSDYDLACCCRTYIKMAVLSLRLYLPVWEALLKDVLGDSDTEGEEEGVYVYGLDGYREVLELMDMRAYFTFFLTH